MICQSENMVSKVARPETLREKVLGSIQSLEESNEQNRENGVLLNYWEQREPTAKEKEAIDYYVTLDLTATQIALSRMGEKSLSPEEARRFYRANYEGRVLADNMERDQRHFELRQEEKAKHPTPRLYEQAVLEGRVERIIQKHSDSLYGRSLPRKDGTYDETHVLPLMWHER